VPLSCTIELSKTGGITVKVQNADDGICQTLILNGTTIVTTICSENATSTLTQSDDAFSHEVESGGKKSSVTQSPTLVRVECERFEIDATTIDTRSSEGTSCTASTTLALQSTGAFTLRSDDTLDMSAAADLTGSSRMNLNLEATLSGTFSGKQATTLGDGAVSTSLKGGSVDVDATSTLTAKGGISTELRGAMTSIRGDASVAVQAPSIQLG